MNAAAILKQNRPGPSTSGAGGSGGSRSAASKAVPAKASAAAAAEAPPRKKCSRESRDLRVVVEEPEPELVPQEEEVEDEALIAGMNYLIFLN